MRRKPPEKEANRAFDEVVVAMIERLVVDASFCENTAYVFTELFVYHLSGLIQLFYQVFKQSIGWEEFNCQFATREEAEIMTTRKDAPVVQ